MEIPSDTPSGRRYTLSTASIVRFWLPLAATWFMMAVEGPYIAAIVARMPSAARSLAAYGVATSLAWLIESPIMMLLSASTALVRDRDSYLALRRFAFLMNVLVTLAMALLAMPSVFRFVGQRMIGLPPEIADAARAATSILIFWPASIGYRRFYQGILVRHHLTRRVAYGTVVRLVLMSATAAFLWLTASLPGATLGAIALISGVVGEAAASRWMARHLVRSLMQQESEPESVPLTLPFIARFYYPLALTSVLSMALGPLVTFGLGRGRAPIESLAVWPVIISMVFLFRSGGVAFQEVGIALTGSHHESEVRRSAFTIGLFASGALALVALTPLERVWLQQVSGLSRDLAAFAVWPLRVLIVLPLLEYVLSIQRARWIVAHRTGVITVATAIEAGGLALGLFILVGSMNFVGAVGGAVAMVFGRLAANAFLAVRSGEVN